MGYVSYNDRCNISVLIDKTLAYVTGAEAGSGEICFETTDGEKYLMYHEQDCCENVDVNDVNGDVQDLIGEPILVAEESRSGDRPFDVPTPEWEPESQTWTFYRLATRKGYVVIRWFGQSNGYYSESVTFGPGYKQS